MSELSLPACPVCNAKGRLFRQTIKKAENEFVWYECRVCGSVLLWMGDDKWAYQKVGRDEKASLLKRPMTSGDLRAMLPKATAVQEATKRSAVPAQPQARAAVVQDGRKKPASIQAQIQAQPQKTRSRKWLLIGGAVVGLCVLCAIVALIYKATPAGKASATESAITSTAKVEAATQTETIAHDRTAIPKASDTPDAAATSTPLPTNIPEQGGGRIVFLHHSTGGVIWEGGVAEWFDDYNATHGTNYQIEERAYPNDPYPWANYPYDYWNLWVDHTGEQPYEKQDTLEMLTQDYDVVVWKHCFPVSEVEADTGAPDVESEIKTIENYQAQYEALKKKMRQFPDTTFIIWTGAAQVAGATNEANAGRAREFFEWVKSTWDEPGDNIYLWDFWQLETEGGLYLLDAYAAGSTDSHPNGSFAARVAPFFAQRIVDVVEGRGDTGSLTGQ